MNNWHNYLHTIYTKYVEADVNADKTKAEWLGFKNLMFQKRQAHYHSIDGML